MRRTILCLLVCLLLTGCTVGIVGREELTPAASTTLTPPLAATDTSQSNPVLFPTPTGTSQPTLATAPTHDTAYAVGLVGHILGRYGVVFVQGNYAYVGDTDKVELAILDISDPTHPVQTSHVALSGGVHDIYVANGYAYVATVGDCEGLDWGCRVALRILNVSDPSAPTTVGVYDWPQREQMPWFVRIAVVNHYVYVADASTGLLLLDVSDPIAPVEVSRYEGHVWSVAVAGDYAHVLYSLDDWTGWRLHVLDVSTPTAPVEVGRSPVHDWSSAPDMAVAGGYDYVSDQSGLRVMALSDPTAPVEVGFYAIPGPMWDTVVADGHAYIVDAQGGLWVLDVSDPVAPFKVGFYDTPQPVRGIAITDDYIYAACSDEGLYILRHIRPGS